MIPERYTFIALVCLNHPRRAVKRNDIDGVYTQGDKPKQPQLKPRCLPFAPDQLCPIKRRKARIRASDVLQGVEPLQLGPYFINRRRKQR
jgi:hypothetical protein